MTRIRMPLDGGGYMDVSLDDPHDQETIDALRELGNVAVRQLSCIASFEAVLERIEEGDTGCPLCGGRPDMHRREEEP